MIPDLPPGAVVEFLTFDVPVVEREVWLEHEERHWSRFLEQQPGFLGKQVWVEVDRGSLVHAVIWWASLEQWKAIPADELARVEQAMGVHERTPACTTFEVVRDR